MAYIKGGIVTRVENIKIRKKNFCISSIFDVSLFEKKENIYLLKNSVLNDNLCDFRKELMSFTNFKGDSLENCEAYCLEISVDKLLENDICLTKDNKKFIFNSYEDFEFETDHFFYKDNVISFDVYFIPIFWDINRVDAENFNNMINFVNNLTRKAMNNKLKGACCFSII